MGLASSPSWRLYFVVGCQTPEQRAWRTRHLRERAATLTAKQQADLCKFAFARSLEKNANGDQAMAAYEDAIKKTRKRRPFDRLPS